MDKYDEAIAYLTKHPDQINLAWNYPLVKLGGCLFALTTKYKNIIINARPGVFGGCLTQIRTGRFAYEAETPELTAEIRADTRIPDSPNNITIETLPVFAEWQRRLDKELGRT